MNEYTQNVTRISSEIGVLTSNATMYIMGINANASMYQTFFLQNATGVGLNNSIMSETDSY